MSPLTQKKSVPADETLAATRLGAQVRALRKARGLTLVQLSTATDLSHPFLSQLERGLAQPSLGSLRRIAVALQTSPLELVAAAEVPPERMPEVEVHPAGGAITGEFSLGPARLRAHPGRPFHPMDVDGTNTEPGELYTHAEDEFAYVVAGELFVELDGDTHRLGPGDSVFYAGGVTHRWWSADGEPFRLLIVKQRPAASSS